MEGAPGIQAQGTLNQSLSGFMGSRRCKAEGAEVPHRGQSIPKVQYTGQHRCRPWQMRLGRESKGACLRRALSSCHRLPLPEATHALSLPSRSQFPSWALWDCPPLLVLATSASQRGTLADSFHPRDLGTLGWTQLLPQPGPSGQPCPACPPLLCRQWGQAWQAQHQKHLPPSHSWTWPTPRCPSGESLPSQAVTMKSNNLWPCPDGPSSSRFNISCVTRLRPLSGFLSCPRCPWRGQASVPCLRPRSWAWALCEAAGPHLTKEFRP